ncbi:unnamed protein product, partial [marine sediment metagenome]
GVSGVLDNQPSREVQDFLGGSEPGIEINGGGYAQFGQQIHRGRLANIAPSKKIDGTLPHLGLREETSGTLSNFEFSK